MSQLPPYLYSTGTVPIDNSQMPYPQSTSRGNVLCFTPPGFPQSLSVKFPDCRLAVCERCKKNYKTRDMCRVRNRHDTEPWTIAYICVTVDETCTTAEGKYVDGPFVVRDVPRRPFTVRDAFGSKIPVCTACKKTNRTKTYCRVKHDHRQLPWCTVYIALGTAAACPSAGGKTASAIVAAAERRGEGSGGGKEDHDEDGETRKPSERASSDPKMKPSGAAAPSSTTEKKSGTAGKSKKNGGTTDKKEKRIIKESSEGDDILKFVPQSRTFLAMVSCLYSSIHWLELSPEYRDWMGASAASGSDTFGIPGIDIITPTYYPPHMYDPFLAIRPTAGGRGQNSLPFLPNTAAAASFGAQQAAWQAHYNLLFPVPGRRRQLPDGGSEGGRGRAGSWLLPPPAKKTKKTKSKKSPLPRHARGDLISASASSAASPSQAEIQTQWHAHHNLYQQQQRLHQEQMMQSFPPPLPPSSPARDPSTKWGHGDGGTTTEARKKGTTSAPTGGNEGAGDDCNRGDELERLDDDLGRLGKGEVEIDDDGGRGADSIGSVGSAIEQQVADADGIEV